MSGKSKPHGRQSPNDAAILRGARWVGTLGDGQEGCASRSCGEGRCAQRPRRAVAPPARLAATGPARAADANTLDDARPERLLNVALEAKGPTQDPTSRRASPQLALTWPHAGEHRPSRSGLDQRLEVLGEAAVAVEPSDGARDHPLAGQQFETMGAVGPLAHLQGPMAVGGKGDVQPPGDSRPRRRHGAARAGFAQRGQQRHRPVAVLDIRCVHAGRGRQPIARGSGSVASGP